MYKKIMYILSIILVSTIITSSGILTNDLKSVYAHSGQILYWADNEFEVVFLNEANYPTVPNRNDLWQPNLYIQGLAPVLRYNGSTFAAFSFIDNRNEMYIVEFDENGNVINEMVKSGASFLDSISVDHTAREVTFWGYNSTYITMSFDELEQMEFPGLAAEASSCLGTENDANNILDGRLDSSWESDTNYFGDQQVEINLGREYNLAYMDVYWGEAYAKYYEVEALINNNGIEEWVTISSVSNSEENNTYNSEPTNKINWSGNASKIRLKLHDSNMMSGKFCIRDVGIYFYEDIETDGKVNEASLVRLKRR